MVLSDENEEQVHKKLLDLCNKLNLDPKTVNTAWDNFRSINKNYVLEVSYVMDYKKLNSFFAYAHREMPCIGWAVQCLLPLILKKHPLYKLLLLKEIV